MGTYCAHTVPVKPAINGQSHAATFTAEVRYFLPEPLNAFEKMAAAREGAPDDSSIFSSSSSEIINIRLFEIGFGEDGAAGKRCEL